MASLGAISQHAVRGCKHRNALPHETCFKQAPTGAVKFLPSPLTPPSLSRNYPSAHWSSFPHLLSGDGVGLVQIVRLTRPGRASVLETHVQGSCVRMHFKAEEGGRVHRIDGVCSDDVVQLCLTYERREGATGRTDATTHKDKRTQEKTDEQTADQRQHKTAGRRQAGKGRTTERTTGGASSSQ